MTQQTQTKQLPKGWKEIPLSEVLDYEQPTEYIVNSEIIDEETPIPVLTANKGFIKGYTKEKEGICKNLPVIIFDDFTTDSKFVNFPFKVKSSAMKILKLKDKDAILKYIFYQMQTINVRVTTHKRYYLSEYRNLDFLFPINSKQKISFEKQQLIVSAIETQFSRLDEAVKVLKSVKDKLHVYKKAVLKKAFEKKEGWEEVELGKLVDTRKEKSNPQKFKKEKYIGMAHVQSNNGKIIEEHFADEMKATSANFYKGDILYGRLRPYLNKVVDAEYNGLCSTEFIILIPKEDIFYKFVGWRLRNNDFVDYAISLNNGDRPRVKFNQISRFKINLPKNISEQTLIVQSIESKFSVIDKVENIIEESLEKAEKLRKSILKSAFEGKLIKFEEVEE